ncbi:hypothetical protein SAMN04487995_2049 [Dyadobacter koreensis]|uniref:Uncharacterized protein n=1 Tax=Dyadobacter koreensis TaxID=408657 RepID=A0A1H6T6N0_9BACT|nr:hypothetical protein [Dyadobacter koreensis]SEI75681.1 hypothetical protein SAMN04487995_2049 [Dyadobacter koreensis]
MKKILFVAAILAFGFTNASAQYGYDRGRGDVYRNSPREQRDFGVNSLQREARQQIAAGIQRGTLNSREAAILMNEYDRIADRERRYSSHGRLSPKEARKLTNDLERLMAETRQMSHRRGGDNWARSPRGRY